MTQERRSAALLIYYNERRRGIMSRQTNRHSQLEAPARPPPSPAGSPSADTDVLAGVVEKHFAQSWIGPIGRPFQPELKTVQIKKEGKTCLDA